EELLHKIRVVEPTAPSRWQPRLPRDLETICLKCLAKEPERRYHSALALAQDLERFLSGEPILGRRAGLVSKLGRRLRRHPALSASLFVVLVTLAVAAAIAVAALRSSRDAALHREIVERENSFRDGLAEADWTREHHEKLIKQIDELERLAPEPGAQTRPQLVRPLVEVASGPLPPPQKPTFK